jgi:hypothetical protein
MATSRRRPILNSRKDYLRELDIARSDAWALARQCERQAEEVQKYADRVIGLEAENARLRHLCDLLSRQCVAS